MFESSKGSIWSLFHLGLIIRPVRRHGRESSSGERGSTAIVDRARETADLPVEEKRAHGHFQENIARRTNRCVLREGKRDREGERDRREGPWLCSVRPPLSLSFPRSGPRVHGTRMRACRCRRVERARRRRAEERTRREKSIEGGPRRWGKKQKSSRSWKRSRMVPSYSGPPRVRRGPATARGNQVPLECDRPREKQNKFLCPPSLPYTTVSAFVRFTPHSSLSPPIRPSPFPLPPSAPLGPTVGPGALLGRNIRHYLRAPPSTGGGRVHLLRASLSLSRSRSLWRQKKGRFHAANCPRLVLGASHLRG